MKTIVMLGALLISGCSGLLNTSFWDDNEAKAAVDLAFAVNQIDCETITKPQIELVKARLEYLDTYATLKGSKDVRELTQLVGKTVDGLSNKKEISPTYCRIKMKSLTNQTNAVAEAVLGRF